MTTVLSKWPRQFTEHLDTVYAAVRAGKVRQTGHNVMVYRPRRDGQVDIECGVETQSRFERIGAVEYCETPGGRAQTTIHRGPYDQLAVSYDAMCEWSRMNGHRLTGICWEIYGDWDEDPATLRTDLFHLLGA